MKLVKRIFIFALVWLAGCANPGIVQLSPDTYMLIKEDHAGIFAFNRNKVKFDTIREANAFAESQGKIAIPISMHEHPVGVLGDWASLSINSGLSTRTTLRLTEHLLSHVPTL